MGARSTSSLILAVGVVVWAAANPARANDTGDDPLSAPEIVQIARQLAGDPAYRLADLGKGRLKKIVKALNARRAAAKQAWHRRMWEGEDRASTAPSRVWAKVRVGGKGKGEGKVEELVAVLSNGQDVTVARRDSAQDGGRLRTYWNYELPVGKRGLRAGGAKLVSQGVVPADKKAWRLDRLYPADRGTKAPSMATWSRETVPELAGWGAREVARRRQEVAPGEAPQFAKSVPVPKRPRDRSSASTQFGHRRQVQRPRSVLVGGAAPSDYGRMAAARPTTTGYPAVRH